MTLPIRVGFNRKQIPACAGMTGLEGQFAFGLAYGGFELENKGRRFSDPSPSLAVRRIAGAGQSK